MKLFNRSERKNKKCVAAANKTPKETEIAVAETIQPIGIDPAIIAVITAAVAASLGVPTNGIIIKSLRRATANIPEWGKTGRSERIYNGL